MLNSQEGNNTENWMIIKGNMGDFSLSLTFRMFVLSCKTSQIGALIYVIDFQINKNKKQQSPASANGAGHIADADQQPGVSEASGAFQ